MTVWRWLSDDAIKPWQHRSWIFPRDALFAERAGPIPDLYGDLLADPAGHGLARERADADQRDNGTPCSAAARTPSR